MILKMLFPAYRDARNAKDFGSRFMDRLGRLFMGSPESKGLGRVLPELRNTYYYCKHDRIIPTDKVKEWFKDSILVNEYRQVEHREISKAAWMALSLYAVIAVCLVSFLSGWGGTDTSGSSSRGAGGSDVAGSVATDATASECNIVRQTGRPPMRLAGRDPAVLLAQCDKKFPQ